QLVMHHYALLLRLFSFCVVFFFLFFFFSSRRRHTRCYRDWSSDVCSSDLSPMRSSALALTVPARAELRIGDLEVYLNDHEVTVRSEERRVGKECRAGWWAEHGKKKEEEKNRERRGRYQ